MSIYFLPESTTRVRKTRLYLANRSQIYYDVCGTVSGVRRPHASFVVLGYLTHFILVSPFDNQSVTNAIHTCGWAVSKLHASKGYLCCRLEAATLVTGEKITITDLSISSRHLVGIVGAIWEQRLRFFFPCPSTVYRDMVENLPSAMEVHLAAVFKDKNPGTRRDFFCEQSYQWKQMWQTIPRCTGLWFPKVSRLSILSRWPILAHEQ